MALIYFAFAFGNWTLNAGKWTHDSREACACIMLIGAGAATVIRCIVLENISLL